MNRRTLPSISSLLLQTPIPPFPPSFLRNISDKRDHAPPSSMSLLPQWPDKPPTLSLAHSLPHKQKTPCLTSINTFNPNVSPIESPDSPTIDEDQLPPIHGDDSPRRLIQTPNTVNSLFYESGDPTKRLYADVPSRSLSATRIEPTHDTCIETTIRKRVLSNPEEPKRKRGRPPTVIPDDELRFLTPTVWNLPVSKAQQEREKRKAELKQSHVEHIMYDSMTAFSSLDMETVLHMPCKKRGRKPKSLIHGNSCFIWKDLTFTRSK